MTWVDIVAILTLLQYFIFSILVGRARIKYGVKAPATTGNEIFERYYRVQMNTLELLVMLLPALFLAAKYWSPNWIALLGAIYLTGRIIYLRAYTQNPDSRTLGFALSALPILILLGLALIGAGYSV